MHGALEIFTEEADISYFQGIIPIFTWRNWENLWNISVRI